MGNKQERGLDLNCGGCSKETLKVSEQKTDMVKARFLQDHFGSSERSRWEEREGVELGGESKVQLKCMKAWDRMVKLRN